MGDVELAMFLGWSGVVAAVVLNTLRVLGVVTLTWATVVVLGAFAPVIPLDQFKVVSGLLLLEGFRLALSGYSSVLFTKHVVTYTGSAKMRVRMKEDPQVTVGRAVGRCMTFLLMVCGGTAAGIAVWQLKNLDGTMEAVVQDQRNRIVFGLQVFYWLALIGAVAYLLPYQALQVFGAVYFKGVPLMWKKYYHYMFEVCLQEGLSAPSPKGFIQFGVSILSTDHDRDVTAGQIYGQQHERFVSLLAKQKGTLELLCWYLRSGSHSEKIAAANLLGFLPLPQRCDDTLVLCCLADEIGSGPIGRGATNSLATICSEKPESLLLFSDEEFKELTRRLINLLSGNGKDPTWVKCSFLLMKGLLSRAGEQHERLKNFRMAVHPRALALQGQFYANTPGYIRKRLWLGALLECLGETVGMQELLQSVEALTDEDPDYLQNEDMTLFKELQHKHSTTPGSGTGVSNQY